MPKPLQLIALVFMVLQLAACQGSDSAEAQAASNGQLSDAARFDSKMSKEGCEILSAQLVGATFDVPADALKQMKIMGCLYRWNKDKETLDATISMIQAHKSATSAAGWFANATTNKTAQEMQAEMEKVSGQLDHSEALDSDLKRSTAKNLLATVSNKALNFADVPGIGDEARVSDDGTVYVRVDNLTFMISAYKGPTAPPPDMKGVEIKQMAAVAQENAAQWAMQTAPQRQQDGIRLARAVVDQL